MMKKIASKQLLALLVVILTSFSVLIANAQENEMNSEESYLNSFQETTIKTEIEVETPQLAICDHNGDQLRNLSDVSEFATCKDTFDANSDGVHDLSDISLYASMNQDYDFCNGIGTISFDCVAEEPIVESDESEVTPQVLAICDHNNDGVRNLSDVSEFATCKDTFDANNDGIHDLSDISLYTSMNQDNSFCKDDFKCAPDPVVAPSAAIGGSNSSTNGAVQVLAICDHNNDGVRNLSDVSEFATCKDTFDANNDGIHDLSDISLYTSMNQDNSFCKDDFKCTVETTTPQVLGVKEANCKIDQDVLGQTQWADGSLIRGCDMKIYHIENQEKHYIKNFQELLKYIGQRIYNVADEVVALF